ncbi:MAG: zf-HC2 domain-containing protein [Chloroflexi bacterium]|nr:zf-HC2 domain-containing protein [Chloroflexota bacterium]
MNCRELVELVTEYLEGTLPSAERERFETHLSTCSGCTSYLRQMRQTVLTLGKLTEETIAPQTRIIEGDGDQQHQANDDFVPERVDVEHHHLIL